MIDGKPEPTPTQEPQRKTLGQRRMTTQGLPPDVAPPKPPRDELDNRFEAMMVRTFTLVLTPKKSLGYDDHKLKEFTPEQKWTLLCQMQQVNQTVAPKAEDYIAELRKECKLDACSLAIHFSDISGSGTSCGYLKR
jgi:hypothetical protein